MRIETVIVGPLEVNCYIVGCPETNECVVIDPGGDPNRIVERVERRGWKPTSILLTHAHIDHVHGLYQLQRTYPVPTWLHEAERIIFEALPLQAQTFGFALSHLPKVDRFLQGGERISFGRQQLKVVHTPGHSPGSCCYLADKCAFVGDVLFAGSIGRTDLPGGNYQQLIHSIRQRILILADETTLYPGHGPATTVGQERLYNPFLQ